MADPVEGTTSAPPPSKAAAAPATPAAPAPKPAAKSSKGDSAAPPDKMRRRVIWGMIYGYLGINFLMFLRFFFPRALYEPNTVFNIGYPSDFGIGIDQRFLMTNRVWVVREPDRIFVIYARCTHLGCTPEWKSSENKFKCPCHGSGYDSEGVNFEGPAPRPMDRAHIANDPTGKLIVDTSKLYVDDPRAGVNQFNDSGAYLAV
jgi:cytochrome b6-f complex iron-sulfur subunit